MLMSSVTNECRPPSDSPADPGFGSRYQGFMRADFFVETDCGRLIFLRDL